MTSPQWLRFVEDVWDTWDNETLFEDVLVELKTKEDYTFAYIQWINGDSRTARRLLLAVLEGMVR